MAASLDLGLDQKDKQTLIQELKNTQEYEHIQNKMRAGVILCAQELMNETPHSQLEQFNKDLPEGDDMELAIVLVNDFLQKKKLNCTSQTLMDELPPEIFDEGKPEATNLASKCEDHGDLLSTVTAGALD